MAQTHRNVARAIITDTSLVRAYFILILGILAASVTPIAIRATQSEGVSSLFIVAARLVIASAVLTPFALKHGAELHRLRRRDWIMAMGAGFWLALNLILLFMALEYTSVLVTSVLRRTTPLWVIGPEIIFFGAVFTRRTWVGLALTLLGGVFIGLGSVGAGLGSTPLLGAGMAAFGAGCLGFYLLIGRKLTSKLSAITYSWLVFTCASLVTVVILLFTHTPVLGYSLSGYLWVIVVTIIAQFIGHISINLSLSHFRATSVSIVLQISVVTSAILAYFVFHEVPGALHMIGSAVIIAGVLLATPEKRRAQ